MSFTFEEIIRFARRFLEKQSKTVGTREHDRLRLDAELLGEIGKRNKSSPIDTRAAILTRLSVGDRRLMWCRELGLRLKPNPAIERLATRIGEQRWNELVDIFSRLPGDFQGQVRRPGDFVADREKLVTDCNKLADLLDRLHQEGFFLYFDESRFNGLLAKQILTSDWLSALESLRHDHTPTDAANIAGRCFIGLHLADPAYLLPRVLREYAKEIEKMELNKRGVALMHFAYGKLNKKEFIKRVVFFLLHRELPNGRSPNKETAEVVNTILDLRGKLAVAANDITQMNKKIRRRYDLEQ